MKWLLALFTSILCLQVSGCTTYAGEESIASRLNGLIGLTYIPHNSKFADWKQINENDDAIEYERKQGDGCSVAILVNKKTFIVESWRFTSTHDECKKRVYVPNV